MQRPRGDNQQRILDFIKSEIQTKGYPPSVREIAQAVGLKSTSTVHGHLQRLEKRGLLHRDAMKPRAMEVTGDPNFIRNNSTAVPVVGRVTAGQPILRRKIWKSMCRFRTLCWVKANTSSSTLRAIR